MDVSNYLIGIILAFVRISSFIFFIPFLKNKAIPAFAKMVIALGISMSVISHTEDVVINGFGDLLAMIIIQFLIGFTLAFIVEMIMSSIIIAGGIIDMDMGYSMVSMLDPGSNQNITVVSNLIYIIFTAIFIKIGGLHMLISGIVFSFNFMNPNYFIGNISFIEMIVSIFIYMFVAAIQIALPFIATMFIVNIVLLILGKSAPQMNIFLTMYMIKISVGLLVLYITLPFLSEMFVQINDDMIEHFSNVMNEMFK